MIHTSHRITTAAAALCIALLASGGARAADGCDGVSLSLDTAGAATPWTLDVPFDGGVATLTADGAQQRQLVLHESCSLRRITFDLAAGPGRAAGRCSIALQGSEATGGCTVDGQDERPVTGIVRRASPVAAEVAPDDGGAGGHGHTPVPPAAQGLSSP